ncbi:MAG: BspA family leucine-rich repeat surface protein [Prevotella sp.]|nr:BspA family leucine-rich repeat surface protein [Prevotella sp.]
MEKNNNKCSFAAAGSRLGMLLLCLCALCSHAVAANVQKAIYCLDNKTLYFVYDENTYTTGGTYTADDNSTHTITAVYENFNGGYNSFYGTLNTRTYLDIDGNEITPTSSIGWSDSPWHYCTHEATTTIDFQNSFSGFRPTSLEGWFSYSSNLTEIKGGQNLVTTDVTSMSYTFYNCSKLTTLDVSSWDTGNVTDLTHTFYFCQKLNSLDISNWNTAKVTTLYNTFSNCTALTSLDVSNWDTANVTDMNSTFSSCSTLTSLDVSGWNTAKVTTMDYLFRNCSSLTLLDINNWNTANVTTLHYTFSGCSKLKTLNVSGWNTAKVTNMNSTFSSCSTLTSLDVSNWDTGNVTDMNSTFFSCSSLRSLNLSRWDTGNVTNLAQTFDGCSSLNYLTLTGWNTEKVTTLFQTFRGCRYVKKLDVSGWNTANVTNMNSTFSSCSTLTSLDVSGWNTAKVTNMSNAFSFCSHLTSLDVSGWNTAKVTDMSGMFSGCTLLTSLTFGQNFSMEEVTSANNAFRNCSKLRYIDFYASDDTDAITSVSRTSGMFNGIPATTVVYLPAGSSDVTTEQNVVYTDGSELKCPQYYSVDMNGTAYVDIELPHAFKTNRAEYTRTMSNTYGSVVLPYDFTSNENIQAYTLKAEIRGAMYFVDAATVPAHTPFAFKKIGDADFTMTDDTENFGITVEATKDTNGDPYTTECTVNITGRGTTYTWGTKGYYVDQTVSDYSDAFYIASDKFYKADGTLKMHPHRVTFHGAWLLDDGSASGTSGGAKFYEMSFMDNDDETTLIEAIEAADQHRTQRDAETICDMQGRPSQQLQRGVNIVRMKDGSVRKVVRK